MEMEHRESPNVVQVVGRDGGVTSVEVCKGSCTFGTRASCDVRVQKTSFPDDVDICVVCFEKRSVLSHVSGLVVDGAAVGANQEVRAEGRAMSLEMDGCQFNIEFSPRQAEPAAGPASPSAALMESDDADVKVEVQEIATEGRRGDADAEKEEERELSSDVVEIVALDGRAFDVGGTGSPGDTFVVSSGAETKAHAGSLHVAPPKRTSLFDQLPYEAQAPHGLSSGSTIDARAESPAPDDGPPRRVRAASAVHRIKREGGGQRGRPSKRRKRRGRNE